MKKTPLVLAALFMCIGIQAQESTGYTRGQGWFIRPETGYFLNVGYQYDHRYTISFGPGFSFYQTNATTIKGAFSLDLEANWYILDKKFTPMISVREGLIDFKCLFVQLMAGVSWKDWDFQVGYGLNYNFDRKSNLDGSVGGFAWEIGYNFRLYPHK